MSNPTLSQAYRSFHEARSAKYGFSENKIKVGFCRFILMQMLDNAVKGGYWTLVGGISDCDEMMLVDEVGFFYRGVQIEGVSFEVNIIMFPKSVSGSQWDDFGLQFQIYRTESLDVVAPVEIEITQKSSDFAHLFPIIMLFRSAAEKSVTF